MKIVLRLLVNMGPVLDAPAQQIAVELLCQTLWPSGFDSEHESNRSVVHRWQYHSLPPNQGPPERGGLLSISVQISAVFIKSLKTWSSGTVEDPASRESEAVGYT